MSDRGEYRAIHRVLLDGPDFQRLPKDERWAFVALKLNVGPSGIEVWYPAELVARLSAQTGISAGGIQHALNTLEQEGWIVREANVVWIDGQLTHEPNVKQANPKHRTMIQNHVAGLPRLRIVARFIREHLTWFTKDGLPTGTPSDGLKWAFDTEWDRVSDTVCDTLTCISGSTENKTETETELLVPSGDGTGGIRPSSEYPADFLALWALYPKRHGGNSKREAFLAWRARLRAGVPAEVLHAGVERYAAFCAADGKVGTPYVMQASTFLGPGERYLEPWDVEPAPKSDERPRQLRATEMILS